MNKNQISFSGNQCRRFIDELHVRGLQQPKMFKGTGSRCFNCWLRNRPEVWRLLASEKFVGKFIVHSQSSSKTKTVVDTLREHHGVNMAM